jgi:hypothetical protein
MDNDGDFVISWTSYGEQPGNGIGIFARTYNSNGSPSSSEFLVNSFTANTQNFSSVAIDNDGDFVVTWESYSQDVTYIGVYAQMYNIDGSKKGSEFLVSTHTSDTQERPSVAMDSNGDFVVTWVSYGQGADYGEMFAQRYNSSGLRIGTEFRVNTYTTGIHYDPAVAMDSAGDFVITWDSYGQEGYTSGANQYYPNYGVYAQRYNSSGIAQ